MPMCLPPVFWGTSWDLEHWAAQPHAHMRADGWLIHTKWQGDQVEARTHMFQYSATPWLFPSRLIVGKGSIIQQAGGDASLCYASAPISVFQ